MKSKVSVFSFMDLTFGIVSRNSANPKSQRFSPVFFKFYDYFIFYIQIYVPFSVNFCMKREIWVEFHLFVSLFHDYLLKRLSIFIELPLSKTIRLHLFGSISRRLCSVDLFVYPLPISQWLVYQCFKISLEIKSYEFSNYILFQNCFTYFSSFAFSYKFLNQLADINKKFCRTLIGIVFNIQFNLGIIDILTKLSFPICEHGGLSIYLSL